ncbi:hypothetical protein [uncultured Phascolarctobacterium sp.]|uniref:hypothetical protein n=1 Tax=uncultured Phascolarctobacterium sp. TaxID=512296 RepID=UPI0025E74F56|nr:hypothetical protein [uncultured Phascolarctobacterium sp.]
MADKCVLLLLQLLSSPKEVARKVRAFWKARQSKNFFEKKFYQKALKKVSRFAANSYSFVVL